MTTFNDFLEKKIKDPEIKVEYETLEPEFAKKSAICFIKNLE